MGKITNLPFRIYNLGIEKTGTTSVEKESYV